MGKLKLLLIDDEKDALDAMRMGLETEESYEIITSLSRNEAINIIMERTGAQDGDLVFFGADKASIVNEALGALRVKLGEDLGMVEAGWRPLWVVDFPMFEWDEKENRWGALHHPFTAPREEDIDKLEDKPGECLSRAYDMVLNGSEIGGGSQRIFREPVQEKVFRLLGMAP